MSLVKTNSNGEIRKSWIDKKSTKRLEKILYKLKLNEIKLTQIMYDLDLYNLDFKEVGKLRNRFSYLVSQLKIIIIRRDSGFLKKISRIKE